MTTEGNINRIFTDFKSRHEQNTKYALIKIFTVLSENDIEDIMQEAYIVLYKSIAEGNVDNNLYPYFFKTCKNLCLKAVRKKGTYSESTIYDEDGDTPNNMVSMRKVDEILQSTEEDYTGSEHLSAKVHATLETMTKRCRELLWNFYAEDKMTLADIAALTGLKNAATAKTASARCRETFRKKYYEAN